MTRELKAYRHRTSEKNFNVPLDEWIQRQATVRSLILAHADDGLIWGAADGESLRLSHQVAPEVSPPLRLETLQSMRIFNEEFETRLWRSPYASNTWHSIQIADSEDEGATAIDETHLLWGTHAIQLANGFTKLEDGIQGLIHIVPLESNGTLSGRLGLRSDKSLARVYLKVRHYLTENEIGVNSIALSRLVGLGVG